MKSEDDPQPTEAKKEPIRWLLLALLVAGFYVLFRPFISPISWAAVLVLGTWPIHTQVRARFPNWPGVSATVSSLLIISFVLAIVFPVVSGLGPEIKKATQRTTAYIANNQEHFEARVASVPFIGETMLEKFKELRARTPELTSLVQQYSMTLLGSASVAAQSLAWLGFNVAFFCLFVFCFFYYGETLNDQLQKVLRKSGRDAKRYATQALSTVTGVLYGLVFTALAQGTLAGIGFAVAGVEAPILLGVLTALLSFVPVGPPLVYLPISVALALNGDPFRGLALATWGTVLVSSADNVLKPYFIAREAKLPLPLVLVGVSGGVLGFGLIGVFVGPVIVGVIQSLWLAWLDPEEPGNQAEQSRPDLRHRASPERSSIPPRSGSSISATRFGRDRLLRRR